MNRLIGLIAAAGGLVLIYMGWEAHQSVGSKIGNVITGSISDRALMFYGIGAVLVLLGLGFAGGYLNRFLRR